MCDYRLGFKYMAENITEEQQVFINEKVDDFLEEAREKFDLWLLENGYESIMGMIVKSK